MENVTKGIDKTPGQHVVIMITGEIPRFIAEVINEDPLILKVQEDGPYAKLKDEDFILCEKETLLAQGTEAEQMMLLKSAVGNGHPFVSGLKSLGVTDGILYHVLPAPAEAQ